MDGSSSKSPTLLITRLSHIGDCILTLPMLAQIKQSLPASRIVWAVESPTQQLLSLVPEIDCLVQVPKSWPRKPRSWVKLRRQLRQQKIDIAIDPQGITKSAGIGWISGADRRIGIRGRWGRELSTYLNNRLVDTQAAHIVDRSIELTSALGPDIATDTTVKFDLPVCQQARHDVDQWLVATARRGELDVDDFVMINPGGSWASKRWEMDRFGRVAESIKREFGLTSVVVWAGEHERQMAEHVVAHSDGAAIAACGTSLRQLAAMAQRARFFLGGDTGPMHIATAVGTPCVGLYGTTRPEESGAYGPQHVAVQKWYQTGSCRQRRSAANDAMRDIQVADVQVACRQMMQRLLGRLTTKVA